MLHKFLDVTVIYHINKDQSKIVLVFFYLCLQLYEKEGEDREPERGWEMESKEVIEQERGGREGEIGSYECGDFANSNLKYFTTKLQLES